MSEPYIACPVCGGPQHESTACPTYDWGNDPPMPMPVISRLACITPKRLTELEQSQRDLATAHAEVQRLRDDAERFGHVVGVLCMGAMQQDRELIAEACQSIKVTFPDGAPFAALRDPAL